MTLHVGSEVGRLRRVIVHRPGVEMKRLTPTNRAELLFDEVMWVDRAKAEHDQFVALMRGRGVEVLYFDHLLRETLAIAAARDYVLDQVFDERVFGPLAVGPLRAMAEAMDPDGLVDTLVGGITRRETLERIGAPTSVMLAALEDDAFVLSPLTNHLFARDASCWIYGGVAVNSMRKKTRRRESVHYQAIYQWHPMFAREHPPSWSDGPANGVATVEGGDVHVIGNGALMVGMSERTTPQGVERLAQRLFAERGADRIVALLLPQARAFMHLDTVMTMVDQETFKKYAGLGMLPSFMIEPGDGDGDLRVTRHAPDEMHTVIADALGLDGIRVLAPSQDTHSAEREQWDDSCNLFALAPGVVVAYERNAMSNDHLRAHGVEVLEVAGSELGRGRGGARCMSCPIERAPL